MNTLISIFMALLTLFAVGASQNNASRMETSPQLAPVEEALPALPEAPKPGEDPHAAAPSDLEIDEEQTAEAPKPAETPLYDALDIDGRIPTEQGEAPIGASAPGIPASGPFDLAGAVSGKPDDGEDLSPDFVSELLPAPEEAAPPTRVEANARRLWNRRIESLDAARARLREAEAQYQGQLGNS